MLQGRSYAVTFGAAVFVLAGVVLAVTNIMLVKQNRQLREALRQQVSSLEPQPGTFVSALRGYDLDGKPLTIEYGAGSPGTFLLVFSPKCRVCEANWPYWESLFLRRELNNFRVVAVSLAAEVTKQYLERHSALPFRVIAEVDPQSILAYKLRFTPQTILISSEGKIEKVWTGLLEGQRLLEVMEATRARRGGSN